jgi:uncharacterized protein (DUF1015 family)
VADVQPFQGIRYNPASVDSISSVITPPYDVISPEEQRFFHRLSPHNIIRLELGEECPSDTAEDNKYTRAASTLMGWLDEGVLIREPSPAFYILEHRFNHEGTAGHRWGLTARVRLRSQGPDTARPHEGVMEGRIADRLKLTRACRVNLSPIMGIVDHGVGGLTSLLMSLAKAEPDISAEDRDGVVHNMWAIRDEQSIRQISAWCSDKAIYIADGHHRYETGLAYQKEQQVACSHLTEEEAFNFVLMTLTGADDPGLLALPAHRLVRFIKPGILLEFRDKLDRYFELEDIEPADAAPSETVKSWLGALAERGKQGAAMALYGLDGNRLCLIQSRDRAELQRLMPAELSQEWKNLDVGILHWAILRRMLGIDTPQREIECLEYTRDGLEAVDLVDSGKYQLAFLMNPIPISSILAVADAGERMPPKSTYFYPKLPTGLVVHPLWDDS